MKADTDREQLVDTIEQKEARKRRALDAGEKTVWFGLGMFGIVGWSVAVPTVACLALGLWIDRRWPTPYSWTLMLLFIGIVLGCLNAWYWVSRERSLIEHLYGRTGAIPGEHAGGPPPGRDLPDSHGSSSHDPSSRDSSRQGAQ